MNAAVKKSSAILPEDLAKMDLDAINEVDVMAPDKISATSIKIEEPSKLCQWQ